MVLDETLQVKLNRLRGARISEDDVFEMKSKLPKAVTQSWLLKLLKDYPISGVSFSLDESKDDSAFGVEARWLNPSEIVEEALIAYPGKWVVNLGYLPVASCLIGSGYPYFVKVSDVAEGSPVVRIPHDVIVNNGVYPEDKIEMVCSNVFDLFLNAEIE